MATSAAPTKPKWTSSIFGTYPSSTSSAMLRSNRLTDSKPPKSCNSSYSSYSKRSSSTALNDANNNNRAKLSQSRESTACTNQLNIVRRRSYLLKKMYQLHYSPSYNPYYRWLCNDTRTDILLSPPSKPHRKLVKHRIVKHVDELLSLKVLIDIVLSTVITLIRQFSLLKAIIDCKKGDFYVGKAK